MDIKLGFNPEKLDKKSNEHQHITKVMDGMKAAFNNGLNRRKPKKPKWDCIQCWKNHKGDWLMTAKNRRWPYQIDDVPVRLGEGDCRGDTGLSQDA